MKEYEKLDFSNRFLKKYKELTPVLNEYFSRLKADLELTDNQIEEKVKLLLKNVHKIGFGSVPMLYKASFNPNSKKITFSAELFNFEPDYAELFCALSHELDHACSFNLDNNKFGLYTYQEHNTKLFNPQDLLLEEIKTDLGSTRRVNNENYTDDTKMVRKVPGYEAYSPFSTMLLNTLGITEKGFLQSADQGRELFNKQMESKFINPNDYYKFIDKFTLYTSTLLNIDTGKDTKNNFDVTFNNLKELSYIGLNLRMEKDIVDNKDIDQCIKNIRYSLKENEINFNYATYMFNEKHAVINTLRKNASYQYADLYPKEKSQKEISKSNIQNLLESKILYLEMLASSKELLGTKYSNAVNKIFEFKKINDIKEYSKEELDLDFKNNNETEFDKELDSQICKIRKTDKENEYIWDNSEMTSNIEHFFETNRGKWYNRYLAMKMAKKRNEKTKALIISNPKEDYLRKQMSDLRSQMHKNIKSKMEVSNIDKDNLINVKKDVNNLDKNNEKSIY